MSHHGASTPYQTVTKLWLEPGGFSPVPSRRRAWSSIPCTVPTSELLVLGQHRHVTGDHGVGILAQVALLRVDVEESGTEGRLDRRVGVGEAEHRRGGGLRRGVLDAAGGHGAYRAERHAGA